HERETVAALSANPSVLWAHPNFVRRIQATPNDPSFPSQWGLQRIQAPLAWDFATGARSVVVAVLDTGVDLNHPDLQGRLVPGRNIVNPGAPPQDDSSHGTHAAGTIAAIRNNSLGIAGVASGVSIMPIKVLEADGSGTDTDVAAGIRWATDNGARVINMSFGGPEPSDLVDEALSYATARGVVFVVAAGNEGGSALRYPAATEPSIAVGATTETDGRASFSNFGSWVDLGAPGVNILSTSWSAGTSTYRAASGTSMAAPHVAGVIGLLLSVKPDLTISEIDTILKYTVDPVAGEGIGAGRLNAARAVGAVAQPSTASSTSGFSSAPTTDTPAAEYRPLDLSRLLPLRISSRS
ncbi:MAG: S8 family serine peptidase, partial [Chloroflexi bacterium]|nr:S8 family serine peptidase [Chloroflexota bacterium]